MPLEITLANHNFYFWIETTIVVTLAFCILSAAPFYWIRSSIVLVLLHSTYYPEGRPLSYCSQIHGCPGIFFQEFSSYLIVAGIRRNYAEPLTPDLGHVGSSNPYLCLPWEGLCTWISAHAEIFTFQTALYWTYESKFWASTGRLDVLRCFRRHGNWAGHLLIQVLSFSSVSTSEHS
jgi:hypothetical protein